MKNGAQECFHVSAPEADAWKRAARAPREEAMMMQVAPLPSAGKNPFGSLSGRND